MNEYWAEMLRKGERREQLAQENADEKFCGDCGVIEGELHELGCDMESCPWCGEQLISCGCVGRHVYPLLGSLAEHMPVPEVLAEMALSKVSRVPFVHYPLICCKCGQLWPEMARHHISKEEWLRYVEIGQRDKVICVDCFNRIKNVIDERSGGL